MNTLILSDQQNNLKAKFNSCKLLTQFSQSPEHERSTNRSKKINSPKKSSQLTDPSESTALAVVVSASASLPISSHQILRFCPRTVTESMTMFSRSHWSMEFCTATKSSLSMLLLIPTRPTHVTYLVCTPPIYLARRRSLER